MELGSRMQEVLVRSQARVCEEECARRYVVTPIWQSFWGTDNLRNWLYLPGKSPRRSGGVPVVGKGIGHVPWHDRSLRTDAGKRLPVADCLVPPGSSCTIPNRLDRRRPASGGSRWPVFR